MDNKEIAKIRSKYMDKYNDIMSQYFYENNILDDNECERIHDENLEALDDIRINNDNKDLDSSIRSAEEVIHNIEDKLIKATFCLYIVSLTDTFMKEEL